MHPLLLYAIKVIACSGILVGYYWFGLRNKVFHHYNRFYLLAVVVLSLCLPLIKISFWQEQQNTTTVFKLLQAVNTDHEMLDEIVVTSKADSISWQQVSLYLYAAVVMVLLLVFLKTLATIFIIYRKHEKAAAENITLIQTEAKGTPFSFFQLIFWNIHIDLYSSTGQRILQHEIAHVQQKHSYDKIFINLVLIACWCNPFFWLIRRELNMIHEFTADQQAVKDQDTAAFAAMILQATYPQHRFDITNQFFYSPIKRRLMMLTKNNHTKAGYISRIMVLPLAALVFVAFTFKAKTFSLAPFKGKKITVVIDAGHGGKDFGGTDGKGTWEKDISLAIAQKIKALNSNSDIDIVLTRETDVYQTPPEKADLVNQNKADLMVSIHVGADENQTGVKVLVARDEFVNVPVSKVLASAIISSFNNNFPLSTSAQPVQRSKGIWILQASNCPSVLLEAGNLRDTKGLAFLKTEAGKEAVANKVLEGLNSYLNSTKTAVTVDTIPTRDKRTSAGTTPTYKAFDEDKQLVILNGKAIGNAKDAKALLAKQDKIQEIKNLHATINQLQPKEAIAKYGMAAEYGASEVTYGFETKDDKLEKVSIKTQSGTTPIYIIDGEEVSDESVKNVKPEKIDKINVLKGSSAVAAYGDRGVNGVIEVTTKKQPLYVVDGKVTTTTDPMKKIDPNNIEKINVLKGESATALYGESAANGVVEIYTKKQDDAGVQTQTGSSNAQNQEKVFVKVEQKAEFPGGAAAWARYMKKINDEFTPAKGTPPGTYLVWIRFIVSKDGSISDIVAETKPGYGLEEQAIDMIKKGPKWKPARQNGQDVNSYYHQPVTFVVK